MTHDQRIESTLGVQPLERLRRRLRARIEAGGALDTPLVLKDPSSDERRAVESLLGRKPRLGAGLSVRPADLEARLQSAGIADTLRDALEALEGPIVDSATAREAESRAWAKARNPLERAAAAGSPLALTVWDQLVAEGTIKRLSGGSPLRAAELAQSLAAVSQLLPPRERLPSAPSMALAELAARATGDAHALDQGAALAALALRYASALGDASTLGDAIAASAGDRRAAWAQVGVEMDPLSSHALVLNLTPSDDGVVATSMRAHAAVGEPLRITLRALTRHRPELCGTAGQSIFVCENPSVVLAAARELGPNSAPLVCVEGQPSLAVRRLLEQLSRAGARLRYHGDFDWPGLRIAEFVLRQVNAEPWRFGCADYERSPAGPALTGESVQAPWDPALSAAMQRRRVAVHEESVMATLLADLNRDAELSG